jgi:imidazolonepropionase-like amidohydrolase
MRKLLRCGKLIDGSGQPGKLDMALYIEDAVIKDVIAWGEVPTSDKESFVDYSEFVVVPGFIDAHVHLVATALQDHEATREAWVSATHAELMAVAARNCIDSLLGGVTTVRDLGDIDFVTLSARDLVKSGVIPGPTIFASGPPVTTTAGHLHWCGNTADTLDEIRKAVRKSCAKEVDVIKVMSSVLNTQVNHPPPSVAFTDTARPQGVCSVAGWSKGQTTSIYCPFFNGAVKFLVPKRG